MPPGAEFAWAAFRRLHADRPHLVTGVGVPMGGTIIEPRPGRIPFSAIDGYARRYGIEGSTFDVLVSVIDACDAEFLAVDAERARERAARRG